MQYYFPYVKDIRNPSRYVRLGWFLEEVKAEHAIRKYASQNRKCTELMRFIFKDKITFWNIKANLQIGYIRKEQVQLCRMKTCTLNSLNSPKKFGGSNVTGQQ